MNELDKALAIFICVIVILIFFVGFGCGVIYQIKVQERAEKEKIECVKDSLYNKYIDDKLNRK